MLQVVPTTPGINRTFMELKLKHRFDAFLDEIGINRTFMELKSALIHPEKESLSTYQSNLYGIEMKAMLLPERKCKTVSIEPLWN